MTTGLHTWTNTLFTANATGQSKRGWDGYRIWKRTFAGHFFSNNLTIKLLVKFNVNRPHQAIWNFTPDYVHQMNNKSRILAELEAMKYAKKRRRREYWGLLEAQKLQQKLRQELTRQSSQDITQT